MRARGAIHSRKELLAEFIGTSTGTPSSGAPRGMLVDSTARCFPAMLQGLIACWDLEGHACSPSPTLVSSDDCFEDRELLSSVCSLPKSNMSPGGLLR